MKVKELRKQTGMSQSKFANYLCIPVANIQHWEQEVNNPPEYVLRLIERIMMLDGYDVINLQENLYAKSVESITQLGGYDEKDWFWFSTISR